jgi:hypothetical protein
MRQVPFKDATGINMLINMPAAAGKRNHYPDIGANREVKAELLKANLYALPGKHNIQDNSTKAMLRASQILETKK